MLELGILPELSAAFCSLDPTFLLPIVAGPARTSGVNNDSLVESDIMIANILLKYFFSSVRRMIREVTPRDAHVTRFR